MKFMHLTASLEASAGKAPEWMLLFAEGWGTLADGKRYLVDEQSLAMIENSMKARGNDVHFDYEHASIQEKAALATGAPEEGWIQELKWEPGKGILARVAWTEKAAAHIAASEYRYFSPVFAVRQQDQRVCYIDSVALTNRPRTNNLTPILASLEAGTGNFYEEEDMDLQKLIAALGLPADATNEMIVAALEKIGVTLPEKETKVEVIPAAVTSALGLKDTDGESVVVASIHALNQAGKTGVSAEEFAALKQQIADRDARDVVAAAMKAGKVAPTQKEWAEDYAKKDLEGFKVYVAKAPVIVPVNQLPDGTPPASGEVDEATIQVAALMGVDIEDVKKAAGN